MELQTRKPNRLKNYDYSQNGAYFITICTKDRKEILSQVIVGEGLAPPVLKLLPFGECIKEQINNLEIRYENVKIDNHVHVGHNLRIEKNAVITAQVTLCGSAVIEEGAWIAPNSSIINRVVIGKYSKVGLGSVVTKDVAPYSTVYGVPAKEHNKS